MDFCPGEIRQPLKTPLSILHFNLKVKWGKKFAPDLKFIRPKHSYITKTESAPIAAMATPFFTYRAQ